MKPSWQPTTKPDNLQLAARRKKTIKTLVAYIRSLRGFIEENDKLHQEKEKDLLRAITIANRAYRKLELKYMKLKKDKQIDVLKDYIRRLEESNKDLRGNNGK